MLRKISLIALMLCLLMVSIGSIAAQDIAATTTTTVNIRSGSSRTSSSLAKLPPAVGLVVEGRNEAGDWLLVHQTQGSIRGWVAIGFVRFTNPIRITDLPVKTDVITGQQPANGASAANVPAPVNIPPEPLTNPVLNLNVAVLRNARAIYQRGQKLGNNPASFMKMGESNTGGTVYMCTFEWGKYDLGQKYAYLKPIIDLFNQTKSFCRTNMTAGNGYSTALILDPTFAPPDQCEPKESPLACEIRRSRPSYALIYYGIADMGTITEKEYRDNMNKIVRILTGSGIIPIFTTFPMSDKFADGKPQKFNAVIRAIASAQHIPLIDLRVAVYSYQDHGTGPDGYHLSVRDVGETTFTGDELVYGRTMRELLTLEVLNTLYQKVNE
jgi:hypothetical protein